MAKRLPPLSYLLLGLLMAAYALFFTAQLVLHYHSFGSRALDLGNMDQSIWNTLHGRPFHQTNQPGATSRLSLHVEPILLPISLLYLVHSGPETLFVLQSIVVALGAVPVFALARLKLHSEGLALVFALVYLMFPAIQGATLLDFHALTLTPTFLLAAFYYLETGRPGRFALFAALAVACKEDVTLLVLMLGLYALFINRQYRLGLTTVALCLVWAALAVFVIPPLFAGTDNIHWDRYGHLGDSPVQIVLNLFIRPYLFLQHLQAVNALYYLHLLLAPTAYTALLNPATLLLALPSLGINLLSNFPPMQEVNALIYAAPIVPAVIISSIYGVARLKRVSESASQRVSESASQRVSESARQRISESANLNTPPKARKRHAAKGTQATRFTFHASRFTFHVSRFTFHASRFTLHVSSLLLLAATFTYHAAYGYFPGGGQFRGWEEITPHHRRAERILAQIPPEAALSAQDRLNPHASQRKTLYIFDRIEDADHIVLDVSEDSWPLHPVELRHRVDQFLDEDFGVVDGLDGYLLLARNRPGLPNTLPDPFFDFVRVENPASFQPRFVTPVTFDNRLQLLGYDLSLGAHEEKLPVITLYWQALQPLERDYNLWPFVLDRQGRLVEDPGERPLVATLWYPTSRWSPAEIIQTRTLPRDLGDEFTLAVGVTGGAWSDPAGRLPISQAAEGLYTFEQATWARLGAFRRSGPNTYEPISPAAAQPSQPRQAQFWGQIQLDGVDLPAGPFHPGEAVPFTLYWRSANPLTVDLTTFVHLRDGSGNTLAQLDWTPQDSLGSLPTVAWQPQRPVVDRQLLPLPAGLPPGEYRLVVGWYYPVTGDRLPLTASDLKDESGDVTQVGKVIVR